MNRRFTLFREFGLVFVDHLLDNGMILNAFSEGKGSKGERISLRQLFKGIFDILNGFSPLLFFSFRGLC